VLISIVVATYNRRDLLARTLQSMLEQTYASSDYEVVLVVDGSTDGTADYVRSLKPACALEIIEQSNRGPAAARNAGIAAAAGDLVLFLDDDIRCEPGLVAQHTAGHESESDSLVHGAIFLAPESPRTLAALATGAWYERHDAAVRAEGLRPDRNVYLNANSSVAKRVLEDLGGFDADVPFPREDFELGLRIWKAGVPMTYRPDAVAYEVFAKPSTSFVRRDTARQALADVIICDKHPDYRPNSPLAQSDPPAYPTATLRRLFRRLPAGTDKGLEPARALSERLVDVPIARRAGLRLLAAQRQMVFDRVATGAVGSAPAFEARFDRTLSVLLYHHVGPPRRGLDAALTIAPERFERQVAWLHRRGYRGIRPREWLAWRRGDGAVPRRAVLFTFDDGYADVAVHALPVLRRHGFGAVIFVVTELLGEAKTWTVDGSPVEGPRLMSAGDVERLAEDGIDFGAHGRTHRDLTTLGPSALEEEIRGSRTDLEDLVGDRVSCFAYPFGRSTRSAEELVSQTYDLAFTTERGINVLSTPPHLLRRSGVGPADSRLDVEWRARTGQRALRRTRDLLRLRTRMGALRDGPGRRT
jgi:peptidoglycan/xylan/chitin deacetylase (PgdA/CDA1 family)/glycosyltransferase involved in cell wall biosynthesis